MLATEYLYHSQCKDANHKGWAQSGYVLGRLHVNNVEFLLFSTILQSSYYRCYKTAEVSSQSISTFLNTDWDLGDTWECVYCNDNKK
jgi:hypothetical protein